MDAAKPVLHNNQGNACAQKRDRCVSPSRPGGEDENETSIKPRVLRLLGRQARRRARAPDRSEIEPGAVRELLGDIFVLSYDNAAGYPFRVAGTRVCALLGRDLKDTQLLRAVHAGQPPRDRRHHQPCVAEEMLAAIAGITATVGRRHDGASGIAAAAVQQPRPRADQPDRTAGAVRKRPRPAPGFQGDVVALYRTGRSASSRARCASSRSRAASWSMRACARARGP